MRFPSRYFSGLVAGLMLIPVPFCFAADQDIEKDSVYSWGYWNSMIKTAANEEPPAGLEDLFAGQKLPKEVEHLKIVQGAGTEAGPKPLETYKGYTLIEEQQIKINPDSATITEGKLDITYEQSAEIEKAPGRLQLTVWADTSISDYPIKGPKNGTAEVNVEPLTDFNPLNSGKVPVAIVFDDKNDITRIVGAGYDIVTEEISLDELPLEIGKLIKLVGGPEQLKAMAGESMTVFIDTELKEVVPYIYAGKWLNSSMMYTTLSDGTPITGYFRNLETSFKEAIFGIPTTLEQLSSLGNIIEASYIGSTYHGKLPTIVKVNFSNESWQGHIGNGGVAAFDMGGSLVDTRLETDKDQFSDNLIAEESGAEAQLYGPEANSIGGAYGVTYDDSGLGYQQDLFTAEKTSEIK